MDTKTKTIDGYHVELSLVPAQRAIELLNPIGKLIAPIIKNLGELHRDASNKSDEVFLVKLADVLVDIASTTSGEQLFMMIRELLTPCNVTIPSSGKTVPFNAIMNSEFRGKTKTILKFFAFAVQENYADFIGDLQLSANRKPPQEGAKT